MVHPDLPKGLVIDTPRGRFFWHGDLKAMKAAHPGAVIVGYEDGTPFVAKHHADVIAPQEVSADAEGADVHNGEQHTEGKEKHNAGAST